MELHFGLAAEAVDQPAHVEPDHGPAVRAELFEERVAAAHAALHAVQAGATARLDVALLHAGDDHGQLGLRPALEDRAVLLDGVERYAAILGNIRSARDRCCVLLGLHGDDIAVGQRRRIVQRIGCQFR